MCTDVLMNDYVGRGKETFTYMYKECKHYRYQSIKSTFSVAIVTVFTYFETDEAGGIYVGTSCKYTYVVTGVPELFERMRRSFFTDTHTHAQLKRRGPPGPWLAHVTLGKNTIKSSLSTAACRPCCTVQMHSSHFVLLFYFKSRSILCPFFFLLRSWSVISFFFSFCIYQNLKTT